MYNEGSSVASRRLARKHPMPDDVSLRTTTKVGGMYVLAAKTSAVPLFLGISSRTMHKKELCSDMVAHSRSTGLLSRTTPFRYEHGSSGQTPNWQQRNAGEKRGHLLLPWMSRGGETEICVFTLAFLPVRPQRGCSSQVSRCIIRTITNSCRCGDSFDYGLFSTSATMSDRMYLLYL